MIPSAIPVLSDATVSLRPVRREDVTHFFRLRSHPEVNKFLHRKPPADLAETQEWLDRLFEGEAPRYNWCVLNGAGQEAGSVCLWNFSADRTVAEIGYELLPEFQGKGLMAAAISKVCSFAFGHLNLSAILAFTHRENAASLRLLSKAGFVLEKDKRDPEFKDNVILSLSSGTWQVKESIARLRHLCAEAPILLFKISEEEASSKPAPGKWSKKEILGHLIDSAANNHQRFVRGQFEERPDISYMQNEWVSHSRYQEMQFSTLITFWQAYNLHLVAVLERIPAERFSRELLTRGTPHTLGFLICDYVTHMEHHLRQLKVL